MREIGQKRDKEKDKRGEISLFPLLGRKREWREEKDERK